MAKQTLPVNFKDDILQDSMAGKRRYRVIQNDDGTISLEDATQYTQLGDSFGQGQINATNQAVNESADIANIIDDLDDIAANVTPGKIAGALAVKQLKTKSIVETGDKYVKYADGRLVQWGRITITYTDGYGTITFPVPFAGTNGNDYFLFAQPKYVNSSFRHELLSAQKISLSKAALYSNQVDGGKTETHAVDWCAIGRWK